ncbi:MAG: hypothetical protein EHM57_08285, partial [Actinobacteria bacterium]
MVLLSACRLELAVNVAVEEDGSGIVEVVVAVDPDGIDRMGGDLATVLEIADVVDAGWVADGPDVESDGWTRVRFRRPFADPAGADAIFEDIAAADGPFQDLAVGYDPSFARSDWTFGGRLDFSGGLAAFGDDALTAELDGEPLGQSREEIEAQLGEPLADVIQGRVAVRLPGEVTSNAPTTVGDAVVWQAGFGDDAIDLEATGEEQRTATLVAVGAGTVCLVLLLVYGLV